MKTLKAICLKDYLIEDKIGQVFKLKRGKEYLISDDKDGQVMVFSQYWVNVPSHLFAGEIIFTDD